MMSVSFWGSWCQHAEQHARADGMNLDRYGERRCAAAHRERSALAELPIFS
jgi:hypothetical protein